MMTRKNYRLFSPGIIANLVLKKRLVRSATAEGRATLDGNVTPEMLTLYQNLAEGGVGMIITGHMAVMKGGRAGHNQTGIWDNNQIEGIARIADQVHAVSPDCKIIAQLSHNGRQVIGTHKEAFCIGPSHVPSPLLKKKQAYLPGKYTGNRKKFFQCRPPSQKRRI